MYGWIPLLIIVSKLNVNLSFNFSLIVGNKGNNPEELPLTSQ